ncbi:hypothetical protein GH714_031904 [Hevea brasiliensis]|uniref:Uncharacterized protein n=1 Tax=Hevea brasiliensis TaxID=3981 RepID=A0A6A6LEJ0_HEVBR|nr:hypothetical protein GH714_031904 [Hevea brasiliensis]
MKSWVVKSFNNDHNHVMISPRSVTYLRCHKKMSAATKNLVEKFNEEGIPIGKVTTMFSGDDQQFSNRDCWNYLRNLRKKNLDVGDAQAVLSFCKKRQVENPNFFYAIQCDADVRMGENHVTGVLQSIHVCHYMNQLSHLAERSKEIYKIIINDLEMTLAKVLTMESQMLIGEESDKMNVKCSRGDLDEITDIQPTNTLTPFNRGDPHVSQTKGRKKRVCKETTSGRFKSGIEVLMARAAVKRRSCHTYNSLGFDLDPPGIIRPKGNAI